MKKADAAWWTTACVIGFVLLFHFSVIILSLLPLNPMSYALDGLIAAYVHPLFAQNWGFFAPNPVASDSAAYARGYYHDGRREMVTPWINFSDPVLDRVRLTPISPLNLPVTALSKAMTALFNDTGIFSADEKHREQMIKSWEDLANAPRGLVVLESGGAAALRALYPNLEIERIQLMIATRQVVPFTHRYDRRAEQPPDYLVFHPIGLPRSVSWSGSAG